MISKELINRINFLANKQKTEGLTDEEIAEQKKLREEYIKAFRSRFKTQLDNIEFIDEE